jgi:hypothetical protein
MLLRKIKEAEKDAKELQTRRAEIESQFKHNSVVADGIPTIVIDGTPEKQALRLRYEIRRRVERIEITFNAEGP